MRRAWAERFALLALVLFAGTLGSGLAWSAKKAPAGETAAKPAPRHGQAHYEVRQGDALLATIAYDWTLEGAHYRLRSVFETAGVMAKLKPTRIVQESQGEVGAEGLRPLHFAHERKNKRREAAFDWAQNALRLGETTVPLPPDTQDMLSVHAQLAWRVPSTNLSLPVVSGSSLGNYRIELNGEETLTVQGRARPTVRVVAHGDDERIEFWLAKATDKAAGKSTRQLTELPLPLRVRVTDKHGLTLDQTPAPPAAGH